MLLFSTWSTLFFSSLLTTSIADVAIPLRNPFTSRQEVTSGIKIVNANTINYNGYDIADCGNPQAVSLQLYGLLGFLHQLRPHLESIVKDAKRGLRSPHGYAAFFKTNTNMRAVIAKYQQIIDATPVIVSEERAKVLGTRTPQPKFQCINEKELNTVDVGDLCNAGPSRQKRPIVVQPGTEMIYLCPLFFQVSQYLLPLHGCPTLDADGKFKPGDGRLLQSGFGYMVYALVLMYNRDVYETHKNLDKIWDMQYAVELNARQSVLNPESYGFYAA
ncbi:MAG: hypothetical protein L6R39_006022, partial [Caloplaca ligustica]